MLPRVRQLRPTLKTKSQKYPMSTSFPIHSLWHTTRHVKQEACALHMTVAWERALHLHRTVLQSTEIWRVGVLVPRCQAPFSSKPAMPQYSSSPRQRSGHCPSSYHSLVVSACWSCRNKLFRSSASHISNPQPASRHLAFQSHLKPGNRWLALVQVCFLPMQPRGRLPDTARRFAPRLTWQTCGSPVLSCIFCECVYSPNKLWLFTTQKRLCSNAKPSSPAPTPPVRVQTSQLVALAGAALRRGTGLGAWTK